jgi:capsular polysaccharide biosynthesis protein
MENTVARKEETSLKELIQVLWDGKILIGVITVAAIIISGLYTFVFSTPSYESSALFTVSLKETVTTPYGEYSIPFTSIADYTSLINSEEALLATKEQLDSGMSASQLEKSIRVQNSKREDMFKLVATATSPEQATEIVDIYTESYLIHFKHTLISKAIDHFCNILSTQIVIDNNLIQGVDLDIASTVKLLEKTDKAIVYGNAMEINPSYRILIERVTVLQVQRSVLERSIEQSTNNIDKLIAERESLEAIVEGNANGNLSRSLNGLVILTGQEGAHKVGRRSSTILLIGLVLGLALGIFVSLFKAYWKGQLG